MVLEKVRQVYPQLTRSQRKLADFIANSYREAAFMTAARLARRVNVNEATVIRFAQRLGYPGYPELIHDVQAIVQEELKTQGVAGAATEGEEPLLSSLEKEVEHIQRAASHVSPALARRLMALLRGTRRIYVAGQGVYHHLAGVLVHGLASLGLDARLAFADVRGLALAIADLENTDVFVGVTGGREGAELARAIKAARERGARTLVLTSSPVSASAQAAELALTYPATDLLAGPSMAVPAVFLDAMVQAVATFDLEGSKRFGEAVAEAERTIRPR